MVLSVMVTNIISFWDITVCGPLNVYQRFEGTRRRHLQGWWIRYQSESKLQAEQFYFGEGRADAEATRRHLGSSETLEAVRRHDILTTSHGTSMLISLESTSR
jgi:hypothetical protein